MGRKNRAERRARVEARRNGRRGDGGQGGSWGVECSRCGWRHEASDPCFDEVCGGDGEVVAAASFGVLAEDGVEEWHLGGPAEPDLRLVEGAGGRDAFVVSEQTKARAFAGDATAQALVEIARLGPDGVLPSGARVRDVSPELFR